MVPTLRHGDAVVVRRGGPIRPGDVAIGRFDNVFVTDDSRRYGPATVDGRVLFRYLPLRTLGRLRPSSR